MYVDTEKTVDQSDQFELKTDRAYIYLIVGKPGSGKTHCLKSIMLDYARQKHFKFGICFTQNTMTSDLDFLPKKAIDDDFSD
jgi:DNA replication protein DnaC